MFALMRNFKPNKRLFYFAVNDHCSRMLHLLTRERMSALLIVFMAGCATSTSNRIVEEQTSSTLSFLKRDQRLLTYNIKPPANSGLPVDSGDYFHPFCTSFWGGFDRLFTSRPQTPQRNIPCLGGDARRGGC